LAGRDKTILRAVVKKLQKIDKPTDQNLINFLSDAERDTRLQTGLVKSILKKLGRDTDALHNISERRDTF
jgi:hypothetical protein